MNPSIGSKPKASLRLRLIMIIKNVKGEKVVIFEATSREVKSGLRLIRENEYENADKKSVLYIYIYIMPWSSLY